MPPHVGGDTGQALGIEKVSWLGTFNFHENPVVCPVVTRRMLGDRLLFWCVFRLDRTVSTRQKPCQFKCRSVAQSGSAPASGAGGRRFESSHSDHHFIPLKLLSFIWPQRSGLPRRHDSAVLPPSQLPGNALSRPSWTSRAARARAGNHIRKSCRPSLRRGNRASIWSPSGRWGVAKW